jgi:hypothetical protein
MPNESTGERGRYAFFQLLWDASEYFYMFKNTVKQ